MTRYAHIISSLRADYGGKGPLLDEAADAIVETEERAEKYRNTLAEYLESHSKQAELIVRLEAERDAARAELAAAKEAAGMWLNATADEKLKNERLCSTLTFVGDRIKRIDFLAGLDEPIREQTAMAMDAIDAALNGGGDG